jgi:hypothetical protein
LNGPLRSVCGKGNQSPVQPFSRRFRQILVKIVS